MNTYHKCSFMKYTGLLNMDTGEVIFMNRTFNSIMTAKNVLNSLDDEKYDVWIYRDIVGYDIINTDYVIVDSPMYALDDITKRPLKIKKSNARMLIDEFYKHI